MDDPDDLPFDRESLTFNPPASLTESRVAGQADGKATIIHTPLDGEVVGQADGKAILLFSPYDNDPPIISFSALEYAD